MTLLFIIADFDKPLDVPYSLLAPDSSEHLPCPSSHVPSPARQLHADPHNRDVLSSGGEDLPPGRMEAGAGGQSRRSPWRRAWELESAQLLRSTPAAPRRPRIPRTEPGFLAQSLDSCSAR